MITKAEYDALQKDKAHLEQQEKYLLGQMCPARYRQFGVFDEKSEYAAAQLNLFSEAKVFAGLEVEPKFAEIEKYYRGSTCFIIDTLRAICRSKWWSTVC